jgi:hypothetical protein
MLAGNWKMLAGQADKQHDKDMQLGHKQEYRHGHEAQTCTCSTDMDFPHEHGHAAWL